MKIAMTVIMAVLLSYANASLYAACDKCCGDHILENVSHRDCGDEEDPATWCHVSECDSSSPGGGCC